MRGFQGMIHPLRTHPTVRSGREKERVTSRDSTRYGQERRSLNTPGSSPRVVAFVVLLLDHKNRVTGIDVVSIGSLSASLVHPREVFKAAVLANAAAILVLHNHPSGDPKPSEEDVKITARLAEAGGILGIPLLDHVVVAADGYTSFAEMGNL